MTPKTKKQRITAAVKSQASAASELSLAIHGFAERPFRETQSARAVADYLERNGFTVSFPLKKIPTALHAAWGDGKPAIGMLGEYDALPNCGANEGTWGHGCGHNLLGTAPAVGAIAAKRVMEQAKLSGRIVYYGCPAEETLAGKVYMARDGAFRDLDAVLA